MSGTTVTSANGTSAATRSASPQLSADLGTFLTLLTTQLRNQDPTKPMDTEQLTQQLVQFATVEQQIQGNQTLSQLLELQQAGQLANSGNLVGRRVTMETDTLPLQNGQAQVVLPAAGQATRAVIEIKDSAGTVLRREAVALGTATTRWNWDGRDANGTQRPDGTYSVSVTGRAEDGSTSTLTPTVTGLVTGATRTDGDLMLRFGNATVGFDKLRELSGSS